MAKKTKQIETPKAPVAEETKALETPKTKTPDAAIPQPNKNEPVTKSDLRDGFATVGLSISDTIFIRDHLKTKPDLVMVKATNADFAKISTAPNYEHQLLALENVATFYSPEMDVATAYEVEPGQVFVVPGGAGPEGMLLKALAVFPIGKKEFTAAVAFGYRHSVRHLTFIPGDTPVAVVKPKDIAPLTTKEPAMKKTAKDLDRKTIVEETKAAAPKLTKAERRAARKAAAQPAPEPVVEAPKKGKKAEAALAPKAETKAPTTSGKTGDVSSRVRELLAAGKNKGFIIDAIAKEFYDGDKGPAGRRTRHVIRKEAPKVEAPVVEKARKTTTQDKRTETLKKAEAVVEKVVARKADQKATKKVPAKKTR